MELSNEQMLALFEPLTHKRIGKIDYTVENYEKYWHLFASFCLISDRDIDQYRDDINNWYSKVLHNQQKWYCSRGQIQSISYKCNRIDENYRRVLNRFMTKVNVDWVWEVKAENRWGDSLGYVIAGPEEDNARNVAKMMYHTSTEVDVVRVRPLFNVANFLTRQQDSQLKIQKKIDNIRKQIAAAEEKIKHLEARMVDVLTNSVCFSGNEPD